MPELVFLLLRLGFLALLWIFVYATLRVIRLDVFGPRVRRATRKPQRVGAAQAAHDALPRPAAAAKPAKPSKTARSGPATQLVVTEGTLAGTTLDLGTATITIGRAPDSTLVVNDDYVSTHHARLVPKGGGWVLEDLNSTNGTFLGKTKVTEPVPLDAGTSVRIGKTVLELRA